MQSHIEPPAEPGAGGLNYQIASTTTYERRRYVANRSIDPPSSSAKASGSGITAASTTEFGLYVTRQNPPLSGGATRLLNVPVTPFAWLVVRIVKLLPNDGVNPSM